MSGDPIICIFDFFAGPGYDVDGTPGSPIRILEKIREQIGHIYQKTVRVKVFFNEFDKAKYEQLVDCCEIYLKKNLNLNRAIELQIFNEDFDVCFARLLPFIREFSSLVYLDQNGIRFLADKYLLELEKTTRTDFLFFVSSSYFWRFGEKEEFKSHIPIDMDEARKNPYNFIHRSLIAQLRMRLPQGSKLRLYPFSLKRGANIHGIIFGASHPRAVEKFLNIAWKRNELNGEANFDIDDDKKKIQLDLFEGKRLTKIEAFQQNLRAKVLSGSISNNFDAFNFALEEAYLGSHAAAELKKMKRENLIDYEGSSPLVTYENVYQKGKRLSFKILKQ